MLRNDFYVTRKNKYKETFIDSGMEKEAAEEISSKLSMFYSGLQEGFFMKCAELEVDFVEASILWNERVISEVNLNYGEEK